MYTNIDLRNADFEITAMGDSWVEISEDSKLNDNMISHFLVKKDSLEVTLNDLEGDKSFKMQIPTKLIDKLYDNLIRIKAKETLLKSINK